LFFFFFLFRYCCSANVLNNLISYMVIVILTYGYGVPYYRLITILHMQFHIMERLLHAIFLSSLSHLCDSTSALLVYFCHSMTSHAPLQVTSGPIPCTLLVSRLIFVIKHVARDSDIFLSSLMINKE